MDLHDRVIHRWQEYRTKKLEKIALFSVKVGFSANMVTLLSFLAGVLAVFFLFQNYLFFLISALLHFFLDALDGVVARVNSPQSSRHSSLQHLPHRSSLGNALDHGGDSLLTILALVKIGWFLGDYYPFIVSALFAFSVLMHLRFKAPVIFMRTATFILLLIFTLPITPIVAYQNILLVMGYMLAGATTLYSLARQLQWAVGRKV